MVYCVQTQVQLVAMSKILLACEEAPLAYTINYSLDRFNVQVDICHDGLKAIDFLNNNKYDLLITEILLPYYSGIEVIKLFNKSNSMSDVLIMAAFDNYSFLQHSLNSNEFSYITKPYNLVEVLKFIQSK